MIVKIQRPLNAQEVAKGDDGLALVYDVDKRVHKHVPMGEVAHLFEGDEEKCYYHAHVVGGRLNFNARAPAQPW